MSSKRKCPGKRRSVIPTTAQRDLALRPLRALLGRWWTSSGIHQPGGMVVVPKIKTSGAAQPLGSAPREEGVFRRREYLRNPTLTRTDGGPLPAIPAADAPLPTRAVARGRLISAALHFFGHGKRPHGPARMPSRSAAATNTAASSGSSIRCSTNRWAAARNAATYACLSG